MKTNMLTKDNLWMSVLMLTVLFAACKKNGLPPVDRPKVEETEVVVGKTDIKFKGVVDYPGKIFKLDVLVGTDTSNMNRHETALEDKNFSVTVSGLSTNTAYYYRYAIDLGMTNDIVTPIQTFKTKDEGLPVVTTSAVSDITFVSAKCGGSVTNEGLASVTDRGICWGLQENPTVADSCINGGSGSGSFNVQLNGLTLNTTYHIRAYAVIEIGVAYGNDVAFTTKAIEDSEVPIVDTKEVTAIGLHSATFSGEVIWGGASPVTSRGICWGITHDPVPTTGNYVSCGTGTGPFSANVTSLMPNTIYYARAYATNSYGTNFGIEVTFITQSEVATLEATELTQTSARCNGYIPEDNSAQIIERGLCWSNHHDPTLDDNHVECGSGTGNFSGVVTGLTANHTYYVRAYSVSGRILTYGNEVAFLTCANLPKVTTQIVGYWLDYGRIGGTVTVDDGSEVTERGVCWSTSPAPTLNGSYQSEGAGTGSFEVLIENLEQNTKYYFRAYATNREGTAYGKEVSFTTYSIPEVTTTDAVAITNVTARIGGRVVSEGSHNVTERGVYWGRSSDYLIYSGTKVVCGSGGGGFSTDITGLTANTTYYYCSYASSAMGIVYGEVKSFATMGPPSVQTLEITEISFNSAKVSGMVTETGGAEVFERGICWSRVQTEPTIYGSHASASGNPFTVELTDLESGQLYFVRAYAMNQYGISYGERLSFATRPEGALAGIFSVSSNNKVYFSQGNLQYIGSQSNPYWKFADNQWDFLGTSTGQSSTSQYVARDLFGYGTSGYGHGQVCYQPWSTSQNNSDYYIGNLVGSTDWGSNAISNGGNQVGMWRTLTQVEWNYLLNERPASTVNGYVNARFAKARVNGVEGVILFPDSYEHPSEADLPKKINEQNASFTSNDYSGNAWMFMEYYGAVFLPAAGSRNGTTVGGGSYGYYWTASIANSSTSYRLFFAENAMVTDGSTNRHYGYAVRLVLPY